MYIHNMGFTLWDPTSLLCCLKCWIVKFSCTVADGFKIILSMGKMYNKIKTLNCKT